MAVGPDWKEYWVHVKRKEGRYESTYSLDVTSDYSELSVRTKEGKLEVSVKG